MATITVPIPVRHERIPPLENGDHLTRAEFERRFEATPNLKKAELIQGVVYMPPPVSHEFHSEQQFNLISLLGIYCFATPGVRGGDNGSLRLDLENMPQPDAYLLIDPKQGGQARIDADGYVDGAPEFTGEIAGTSASYDLHMKMEVYQKHGIREYFVWRVFDKKIDWFQLSKGKFKRLLADSGGVFRSHVFPGLWVDAPALLRRDFSTVAKVLQRGLKTKEHAAFVRKLRAAEQLK